MLELERQSPPHQPLFAAVRAEVIHALGEPSQAQRLLSSVLEANPGLPEGYVTRGLLYAMDNDLRKATNMWQKGLSTQGQEVVLRRNLAIALATRKSANRADRRKALEHAELASQLTLEESWSVEAALALAMHANGEHEDALERIALATDLTSGKCATYCHEIREALEEDQLFAWDFKRF